MRGMAIRTRLNYLAPNMKTSKEDKQVNKNDARYEEKMKRQRENSHSQKRRNCYQEISRAEEQMEHAL